MVARHHVITGRPAFIIVLTAAKDIGYNRRIPLVTSHLIDKGAIIAYIKQAEVEVIGKGIVFDDGAVGFCCGIGVYDIIAVIVAVEILQTSDRKVSAGTLPSSDTRRRK